MGGSTPTAKPTGSRKTPRLTKSMNRRTFLATLLGTTALAGFAIPVNPWIKVDGGLLVGSTFIPSPPRSILINDGIVEITVVE